MGKEINKRPGIEVSELQKSLPEEYKNSKTNFVFHLDKGIMALNPELVPLYASFKDKKWDHIRVR